MSDCMDKQYELLRLVVQKMEIRSEADEKDVGTNILDLGQSGNKAIMKGIGWSSPVLRKNLLPKISVVSKLNQTKLP